MVYAIFEGLRAYSTKSSEQLAGLIIFEEHIHAALKQRSRFVVGEGEHKALSTAFIINAFGLYIHTR